MAGSADLANGVAQCDSLEHSDRLWNFVQASTLIALYLYQNGRFIEAYHQTCQVCPHFLVLPKKKSLCSFPCCRCVRRRILRSLFRHVIAASVCWTAPPCRLRLGLGTGCVSLDSLRDIMFPPTTFADTPMTQHLHLGCSIRSLMWPPSNFVTIFA